MYSFCECSHEFTWGDVVALITKCDPQTGGAFSKRAANLKLEDGLTPEVASEENRIHIKLPDVLKGLDIVCDPQKCPISGSRGPLPSRIYVNHKCYYLKCFILKSVKYY